MIGSGYDRDRSGAPEAPVGPRVRLYELAKDLGLQPKDLVAKVRAMAIDVANHMSQIEPADADRIRRAVDRERHESLVEERLTVDGTVIRRRSKVVAAARRPAPARQVVTAAPAAAPAPPRQPRRPRAPACRAASPACPRPRAGGRRQGRAGPGTRRHHRRLPRRARRGPSCGAGRSAPRRRLPPRKRPSGAAGRCGRRPSKPIEVPVPQPSVARGPEDDPAAGGHRLGRHGRVHPAARTRPARQ